jgi:alpha-mannosidase
MAYPRYTRTPKAHPIDSLRKDRLATFISRDQWQGIDVLSVLYKKRYSDLPIDVYSVPNLARPSFQTATANQFRPTQVGESFGPSWSTHWFRITVDVPEYEQSLEFHWDSGSEGMIWTEDGEPVHGLTRGHRCDRRVEFIIPKSWKGKKTFYVEASMNGMFGCANGNDLLEMAHPGNDPIQPPNPDRQFLLETAELVAPNPVAWDLYWDFVVISDVARTYGTNTCEAQRCLAVANDIVNAFRRNDPSTFLKCRALAKQVLGEIQPERTHAPAVSAIGHCHIDSAWLWPFGETKRKVARSWATQVDLMNRYPEHHFAASQAQQYKWLKQDYPSLFQRVVEKIKGGQFLPVGGSWVENDTNFSSGESLSRQLLYGQRFFQKEFGVRCKTFWLPEPLDMPRSCRS